MGYKFKEILASPVLTQEACRVLLGGQYGAKSLTVNSKIFDQFLAVQHELYQKAMKRQPSMAVNGCFFTRQALEQASSEPLARWKAESIKGKWLFDICGGLGSDCFQLAPGFREVYSCDPDEELGDLFSHNAQRMGLSNVHRLVQRAEDFLRDTELVADWVYFDPDRRTEGRRQTGFKHYMPEPESLYQVFAAKGKNWLIKLSPLDDLQAVYQAFPGLSGIRVLSSQGEVKELLVHLMPEKAPAESPELVVVELEDGKETCRMAAALLPWPQAQVPSTGGKFVFEPSAGLIKSEILQRNPPGGWRSGNTRGTLWFTDEIVNQYPGRWTEVEVLLEDFSLGKAARVLKEKGITAASVKAREIPMKSESVRSVLQLAEGDVYRIYLSQAGKQRWLAAGKAIRS
jgi:hypothetical protein